MLDEGPVPLVKDIVRTAEHLETPCHLHHSEGIIRYPNAEGGDRRSGQVGSDILLAYRTRRYGCLWAHFGLDVE
jgi:hypothetical protein